MQIVIQSLRVMDRAAAIIVGFVYAIPCLTMLQIAVPALMIIMALLVITVRHAFSFLFSRIHSFYFSFPASELIIFPVSL